MAITANVDLGNGVTASSCYIIVPNAYVKKFRPEEDGKAATFKLIYDVDIYENKAAADTFDMGLRLKKRIRCREVDHFKIDYDPSSGEQNAFKLSYAHLKTNSKQAAVILAKLGGSIFITLPDDGAPIPPKSSIRGEKEDVINMQGLFNRETKETRSEVNGEYLYN